MSKRWKWAAGGVAALAGVLILLLLIHSRNVEPRFHGRTLSNWVQAYSHDGDPQESERAVLTILSNDLPAVIKLIIYDPMQSASNQVYFYMKLPQMFRYSGIADYFLPFISAARRSDNALNAFGIVHAKAEFAIPQLSQAMLQTNSDFACNRICYALAAIGPASRGAFEMMITNRTHPFRKNAVDGLAHLSDGIYDSMEVLKVALEDPDPGVRQAATNILAQVAGRKSSVPEKSR